MLIHLLQYLNSRSFIQFLSSKFLSPKLFSLLERPGRVVSVQIADPTRRTSEREYGTNKAFRLAELHHNLRASKSQNSLFMEME